MDLLKVAGHTSAGVTSSWRVNLTVMIEHPINGPLCRSWQTCSLFLSRKQWSPLARAKPEVSVLGLTEVFWCTSDYAKLFSLSYLLPCQRVVHTQPLPLYIY